jgi:hypothetical protein
LKVIADRVPESKPEPPKAEAAPRVDHSSVDSDQIDELWKLWPDEDRPVVTLSGRVVDLEGKPITDMRFFSSYTLGGSHMINPNFLYWTTTDGEGRFVLRGMTGRPPKLYLEKGGFQGHLVDIPPEGDDVTLIYQMFPDPSWEKSMETFQRSRPSMTRVPYTPGQQAGGKQAENRRVSPRNKP